MHPERPRASVRRPSTRLRPAVESIEPRLLPSAAPGDVLTYHNDNGRTGQALFETTLTPTNVNAASFGKLFTAPVDGYVYAQPLTLSNVPVAGQGARNLVFVATEHDSVYAFDADRGGEPAWHRSFINPAAGITTVPAVRPYQLDLYPEVGITSTPVIDPATNTLYVLAETMETAGRSAKFVFRLHALDVATGAEKFGGPAIIATQVRGTGAGRTRGGLVPFLPEFQLQRPALLLANGVIYSSYASLGDHGPYHGWIIGSDARTLQTVSRFNATPNGSEGGIWMSGAGPSADADGNVYALTGNGTLTAPSGGKDYGDSFVKLDRSLRARDYFAPPNQAQLRKKDLDLGSGGALVVPDGTGPRPRLLVGGGKDGVLYVLNRDAMGHCLPKKARAPQAIPNPGHAIFSTPAYFRGRIYVHAVDDALKSYAIADGRLVGPTARGPQSFGYPGATPSISASGEGKAIVWEIQSAGKRGAQGAATLHALDANSLAEIYSSAQTGDRDAVGPYVKFSVPTVSNGKVFVGTQTGLVVYGLRA